MKKFLLFIICLSLVACDNRTDIEKVITDTTNRGYWIRMGMDSTGHYKDFFDRFEFYKNGKYTIFSSTDFHKKGDEFRIGIDETYSYDWQYNTIDSVLTIGGLIYKIDKASSDSILMSGWHYKGKYIFLKRYE
ncbi:hypothetical protein GCM10023149_47010 [Mucilaginibacter gynuensis]|uniref:Lipoprotein n=1 Tax=Mucilaginibacter gynuensis TaxID=1302236 RepID=A0ABP8HCX3_9SPHI